MSTLPTTISLPSDANATGRSFGSDDLVALQEVLQSGTLNCTRGTAVKRFETEFAALIGTRHCRAVTSGTAAIHTALAAVDLEPGDEVISTPITDMGAISPILFQAAIPVFADVDPETCNVTAETIRARITRRTKAVVVTHLFGAPCDMDPILAVCAEHDLPVIEDAAQAYLAEYKGRRIGTIGWIGCFSMQQGKHLSTGEGGMVVTDDPVAARRMRLFSDKAWGYGEANPDHEFLALNYRMTELAGAVAHTQLTRLEDMVRHRIEMAERLTAALRDVPGLLTPVPDASARHVYWRYPLRVDTAILPGGPDALGAALKERGVFCAPRYVQKPAFECAVLRDRRTFGRSEFPFKGPQRDGEPDIVYDRRDTPGAIAGLNQLVVLPLNEKFTPTHIDFLAAQVRDAAEVCR